MANACFDLLASLGIIEPQAVEPYHPRVRDRDDIAVLRCRRSGVIFLSRSDHAVISHYEDKTDARDITPTLERPLPTPLLSDALRRAERFGDHIHGRRWLDVGTGSGDILDVLGSRAARAVGIEPNSADRAAARARGLDVRHAVEEIAGESFDVITLFHVLEHLPDPLAMLRQLAALLAPRGLILIEVPHARDMLLAEYDCAAFRAFTLWSEHLVLHTRDSLAAVIAAAGLECQAISGYQRYPLANHLHWLRHGAPGGHERWSFLRDERLDQAYGAVLAGLDRTDTLIAQVRRPEK